MKEYPGKDTFHVGDTIWFEIHSPDILNDLITNKLINYSGVENLGSVIGVQQLDSNNNFIIKAFNKFSHILVEGKEVINNIDAELFREYLFEDKNGYYQFKYAFVARDTGIFRVSFSNAANVYRSQDKCTKAAFVINFTQTDQHYYLFPGFQGNQYDKSGTYYFRIR